MRARGPIPIRPRALAGAAAAALAVSVPAAAQTGADGLPPPVAGKTVNLKVKLGTVRYKLPGHKRFVKLTDPKQVPLGTIVDTVGGRVTLTSAADLAGGTQHAWFYRGVFAVGQTKGSEPVTELSLAGAGPVCGAGASAAGKRRRARHLWGEGKGAFRTKGRFSSATVRGTRWVVFDQCRGTLTRVTDGVVAVRDFARHKTVLVRAGHRYLARRPK